MMFRLKYILFLALGFISAPTTKVHLLSGRDIFVGDGQTVHDALAQNGIDPRDVPICIDPVTQVEQVVISDFSGQLREKLQGMEVTCNCHVSEAHTTSAEVKELLPLFPEEFPASICTDITLQTPHGKLCMKIPHDIMSKAPESLLSRLTDPDTNQNPEHQRENALILMKEYLGPGTRFDIGNRLYYLEATEQIFPWMMLKMLDNLGSLDPTKSIDDLPLEWHPKMESQGLVVTMGGTLDGGLPSTYFFMPTRF